MSFSRWQKLIAPRIGNAVRAALAGAAPTGDVTSSLNGNRPFEPRPAAGGGVLHPTIPRIRKQGPAGHRNQAPYLRAWTMPRNTRVEVFDQLPRPVIPLANGVAVRQQHLGDRLATHPGIKQYQRVCTPRRTMGGRPVPRQLGQVLPRFAVREAASDHAPGRVRLAALGKRNFRVPGESGV